MSVFRSQGAIICGIATAVPSNVVENQSLSNRFEPKEVRKFLRYSGVQRTHRTSSKQTASDLGFAAADFLINKAGIDRSEIGLLLFVSLSPDYRRPPTSCVLQYRLGLSKDCSCWDIGHGCSGFIYGHQTMLSLMAASDHTYGLMILGETTSKLMSPSDRSSMLFGDAGSAVLYKKGTVENSTSILMTDGAGYRDIIVPGGGFRDRFPSDTQRICEDGVMRSKNELHMNGVNIHNFTVSEVPKIVREYLNVTDSKTADYDRFFFHQANRSIFDILCQELNIDEEKAPNCLCDYGNTSCTSIPLMICNYYKDKSNIEERILCCGFGVGLSWGVTSFEIQADSVFPILETEDVYLDGIMD